MRIALIAMSWTGARNRKQLGPGFDAAAFTARNNAIASLPSLALLTLAGMTPPRHELHYFEVSDISSWKPAPGDFDLAAFSSYSACAPDAYKLSARFRAAGIPTVIGGPHVSLLPEEAAQHVDAVVIGEGETSWLQVLEDCERGQLEPFYGSLDAAFDLREAPMPAFELLQGRRHSRITVETSRGCPHRCEFCASSILLARKYKQKPIAKVLAEIGRINELFHRPFIEFADDNSFVNRKYWYKLLPELKKRNVRWFAEADIRIAREEKLLEMMRESGCKQVLIGLESPSRSDLDGLELHNNWKSKQEIEARDAVRIIQSHGIMVNGCFVMGLDGQRPDVFDAVYDFAQETSIYDVQVTVLTPFPGTPLYTRLKAEGRLLEDGAWEKCTLFDINFQPKNMSIDTLKAGFSRLGLRLYDDAFANARRADLRRKLRAARRERALAGAGE